MENVTLTCGVGHRDTVAADRCGLIEYHRVYRRRSGHVVPPCVGNIAHDDTGAIKPTDTFWLSHLPKGIPLTGSGALPLTVMRPE